VKVLGVDVARKRISLTLRLDDEPGRDQHKRGRSPAASERGRGQRRGSGERGDKGGGEDRSEGSGDGAMAEALRRAGLVGDPGGPGDR